MHPLEEIDSIDIGLLKSKNDSKDEIISVDERVYSFNIWTISEKHQETNIKFDDDDFKDKKKLGQNQSPGLANTAQSFIGSFFQKGTSSGFGGSTMSPPDSPTGEPSEIIVDSPLPNKVGEIDEDSADSLSIGDDLMTKDEDEKERDIDGLRNK